MRRGRRLDVLVADDQPAITRVLARLLSADCEVREAAGVCEALTALSVREPDVLVTDVDMDQGGGKYLLAIIADEHPGVRRVVYSAAPCARLIGLLDCGLADAAVSKSDRWATLVSKVRAQLSEVTPDSSVFSAALDAARRRNKWNV